MKNYLLYANKKKYDHENICKLEAHITKCHALLCGITAEVLGNFEYVRAFHKITSTFTVIYLKQAQLSHCVHLVAMQNTVIRRSINSNNC